MPEMPQAAPTPDRPPLHLKGGYLVIASPTAVSEASAIREARPQGTLVILANEDTAPMWRKVTEVDQVITHHSSDSVRKIIRLLKDSQIPFDSAIACTSICKVRHPSEIRIPSRKIKQISD